MIVTKKRPKAVKTPVEVAKDRYELWYSKPVNLGTIDLKSNMWVTADGRRFISSRDALEYLSLLHDLGFSIETADESVKEMAATKVYQARAHKAYKGRGSRSFRKGVPGVANGGIQLPEGMSLSELKDLIALADRLRGVIEPAGKTAVPTRNVTPRERRKNGPSSTSSQATPRSNGTNGSD